MAGVSFDIKIDDAEVRKAVSNLYAKSKDMSGAFDAIGHKLENSTVARFNSGTDPDGNPWKESIRARLFGGKTLVNKKYLKDSITHNLIGIKGVEVGTNKIYGAIHQLGGTAGRNHSVTIDARPFLGISAQDKVDIVNILKSHLEGALK